jgi:hypothetical protein
MRLFRSTVPLLVCAVAACSSPVAPRQGVTLLVINERCATGRCDSLEVLAFPTVQPHTPGGLWHIDLGLMTSAQQCFILPAADSFVVSGPDGATVFSWSDAKGTRIAALPPNEAGLQAQPTSQVFVPAAAAGWKISVPTGTTLEAAASCSSGRGSVN